jgi:fructokinase
VSDNVLCIGEILWDALPDGLFLGGAPFNVAFHLQALGRKTIFVSRVGDDRLGHEALRRMRTRGLGTDLVQLDDSLPTGFVQVELGGTGEPDYEILEPAAWDAITLTDALRRHAEQAGALVYGSLAQRAPTSQQTIRQLCATDALCVFDINLRSPFADPEVVEQSMEAADVVKFNDDELERLRDWFGLSDGLEAAVVGLADAFGAQAVCVTGGREGAWLWRDGAFWHHPGHEAAVVDAVGAGDAFLAALLAGLLTDQDGKTVLDRANRLGAYVAAHPGALPPYTVDTLSDIAKLPLESPGATA